MEVPIFVFLIGSSDLFGRTLDLAFDGKGWEELS